MEIYLRKNVIKGQFPFDSYYLFKDAKFNYLAMELMIPFDDFKKAMKKHDGYFNENEAKLYFSELLLAIEHMNAKKLSHGDLPGNILLDQDGHLVVHDVAWQPNMPSKKQLEMNTWQDIVYAGFFFESLLCKGTLSRNHTCYMYKDNDKNNNRVPVFNISEDAASLLLTLESAKSEHGQKEYESAKEYIKMIKTHPFFIDMDWSKLSKKQIPAIINITEIEKKIVNHYKSPPPHDRKPFCWNFLKGVPMCDKGEQFFKDIRYVCKLHNKDWKNIEGKEKAIATHLETSVYLSVLIVLNALL